MRLPSGTLCTAALHAGSLEVRDTISCILAMTTASGEMPLKLLALDGGGIRGLSELLIIKEVMHRLMIDEDAHRESGGVEGPKNLPKPCEYFDLIGGTSTGGIIALMLGRLRMDMDSAIAHYDTLVKAVFSQAKVFGEGKFKATKLEEAVKAMVNAVTNDSESPLIESDQSTICRTFVCARNAHNINIPVLLRTYESPRETPVICKIWEAARATSAGPGIFKRINIGRNQPYIDGGMGHNNPSQLVLDEAHSLFPTRPFGCLVSIGTGRADVIRVERSGFCHRIISATIVSTLRAMAQDCERTHQELLRRFANTPGQYFRLNVDNGLQSRQLSEWERLDIIEAHTTQYMKKEETQSGMESLVAAMKTPIMEITVEQLAAPRAIPTQAQNFRKKPCPSPVLSFKGRKDILDTMKAFFENDTISDHTFVLYGLGGSGKSQIAFQYVKESNIFAEIYYVDATNESILKSDLESIGPERSKLAAEQVSRWLTSQTNRKWLLVIDNADDIELNLQSFLPANGNIIITTRNIQLRSYATEDGYLTVGNMHKDDAVELLLHLTRMEKNDENIEQAEKIVQDLYYLALAISQAGAYIFISQFSLPKYHKLYMQEHDKMLQQGNVQGRDKAVYATWKLSYDKLDESAKFFLQICSILHHEGISEEIFERAALSEIHMDESPIQSKVSQLLHCFETTESHWSLGAFQEIIIKLISYSLIELDYEYEEKSIYRMHPLVQYWGRTLAGPDVNNMRMSVLTMLGMSVSDKNTESDHRYQRRIWPHISQLKERLDLPEIDVQILEKLGIVCGQQGHWKDEEIFTKAALDKSQKSHGSDNLQSLKYMMNLGSTYYNQGRWKDAEKLQSEVLQKRIQLLGDDHPDTLTIMSNLASTYSRLGLWKDAEKLQKVVLQKRKKLLGENHPDTLTVMSNLANVYSEQGHWKDAKDLQVEAFEKRKEVLGENHPDTLAIMLNLATTYRQQGHLKDAQSFQKVVLQKMKDVLGDDHPYTLGIMSNLAITSCQLGLWNEAKLLQVVVVQKMTERLGDSHPQTLGIMANLGQIYCQLNMWKDAESLQVVVLEKRKQILGENHPDILVSMSNLAHTYFEQGHWKDAERLQILVLQKRKELLEENHPRTLEIMSSLAKTYSKQGLSNDAKSLQVFVFEKRKELFGENHPDTLTIMADLANTYSALCQWEEAKTMMTTVMDQRLELLGEHHHDTIKSIQDLAGIYRKMGNISDAECLEKKVSDKNSGV